MNEGSQDGIPDSLDSVQVAAPQILPAPPLASDHSGAVLQQAQQQM